MAVEQLGTELRFKRGDLAAERRLARGEPARGLGEATSLGDVVEQPELVPVGAQAGTASSAAIAWAECAASQRSASSAAMQPVPAAVIACR